MSCDRFDLSSFVDEELAGAAREAVLEHLAGCAGCRAEVTDLTALAAALRGAEPPPAREAAIEAAVARARAVVAGAAVRPARPSPLLTLARLLSWRVSVPAPALALALVVLVLALVRMPREREPGRAPRAQLAVFQEWEASALWEAPAPVRVLVDERVEL